MIRFPTRHYYQCTIDASRSFEPGPRRGAAAAAAVLDTCLLPPRLLLGRAWMDERLELAEPGHGRSATQLLAAHGIIGLVGAELSQMTRVLVQAALLPLFLYEGCIFLSVEIVLKLLFRSDGTPTPGETVAALYEAWMSAGAFTEKTSNLVVKASLGATMCGLDQAQTGLVVAAACISACLTGSLPSFRASKQAERDLLRGVALATQNWPAAEACFQRARALQPQARIYQLMPDALWQRNRALYSRASRDSRPSPGLGQAISIWAALAGRDAAPRIDPAPWDLTAVQRSNMFRFTQALKQTRDYLDGGISQSALAGRVLSMFERFDKFPEARAQVLDVLSDLACCADRRIMVFAQAEEVLDLCEAQQSGNVRATLQDLGRRQIVREVIRKHAARAARATGDGSESVEVFLFLDIAVSRALGVPAAASHMLYENIGQQRVSVVAAAIEEARAAVAADSPAYRAFFAGWEPWQGLLRREQADATTWAGLEADTLPKAAAHNETCFVTLEPVSALENPMVIVHGGQRVYAAFEAGMQWWRTGGRHPITREQVPIEALRRVV